MSVLVDYGQWYLFDAENRDDIGNLVDDPVSQAELWERRCTSFGSAAIVYTLKQHGPTVVVAHSGPGPSAPDGADHIAEFSMVVPSGRLAFSGWDTSEVAGTLDVPTAPLRVRIQWIGLDREMESEDDNAEEFRVDVFPDPKGPGETILCWPTWAPPTPASSRSTGLRLLAGPKAEEARASMEWVPLLFWPPYPTLPDGYVTSMYRDARDDSRWAHGTGSGGHAALLELTPEEARDLEAQGFPSVRTFAIDKDGRIWTSDVMPLERVPCLNLVPPWQFEAVKGMSGGLVGTQVIDLPAGWGRLIRRPREGGPPEEVAAIDDASDGLYQRWHDGQPAPTS
jgi:hypothetical protein